MNRMTGWVPFERKGKRVNKEVDVGGGIACAVSACGSDPNKCSIQN